MSFTVIGLAGDLDEEGLAILSAKVRVKQLSGIRKSIDSLLGILHRGPILLCQPIVRKR